MNDKFKVSLPLHDAFKHTIPLPMALLNHYAALDIKPQHLVYILHIMGAYMEGREANHTEIAAKMGITPRILRIYNKQLRDLGVVVIVDQTLNSSRIESLYDLRPLLDLAVKMNNTRPGDLDNVMSQIAAAVENGDMSTLADLVSKYKQDPIGSFDPMVGPIGSNDPMGIGSNDPMGIGSNDPMVPEVDHRIKRSYHDDDDQYLNQSGNHNQSSPLTGKNPGALAALLKLRGPNGSLITRHIANHVLHKAIQKHGEQANNVVLGWVNFAANNPKIQNPPGFVRWKIESGDLPPASQNENACPECERPLKPGAVCLYCSGVIQH